MLDNSYFLKKLHNTLSGKWRIISLILALFFISLSPTNSFAQYHFDNWTTNDGLPQNGVRAIVQTSDGYIWFTTFDGLVRFDGVHFTVFNKSNSKGIDSNRFFMLSITSDGGFWAGTEDGVLTIYKDGKFTSYSSANGFAAKQVKSFRVGNNKELQVLTDLGWLSLQNGKFNLIEKDSYTPDKKVYLGRSKTQWIITSDVVEEIKTTGTTKYQIKLRERGINSYADTAYEDKKGNLWVGDPSGVYRLKDGNVSHYTEKDGVPLNNILHDFWEEKDGSIWFATGAYGHESVGLIQFKDGKFTTWGTNVGFPNSPIFEVFKDREGIIWLSTNKGLCRFRKQVVTPYSTSAGLIHSEAYPILQSQNGDVWIGTTGGLSQFREGRFTNYELRVKEFSFQNLKPLTLAVQSLLEDKQNNLWVGCIGALLVYENGKIENQIEVFTGFNTFQALYLDKEGTVWAGTSEGLLKIQDKKIVAQYTTKDGLPSNDIKAIYQDKQGNIWLGTYGGLVLFKNEKFTSYTIANGLAGNRIRSIYEDKTATLWIGTYDEGMSRFRDGRFTNYKVDQGLFNNGVFSLQEDQFGNFWISCNKGIYRVSYRELEDFALGKIKKINCTSYGTRDGLLNTECNGGRQPASIKTTDGRFWFPTQDGVAIVDPEVASTVTPPPPIVIEAVSLEHELIDYKNGITVPPNKDDLEISYTGLSFINSDQVKFKYKLEGKDNDWIDAGTRRTAYYPFIPPGNYNFQVMAASSDGVWSLKPASFSIFVQAPFWLQWWFWFSMGVLVTGTTILIFRIRIAQLKKIQAIQVAFSHQLIESQEVERKRIASELHDSLGQHLLIIKNWSTLALTFLKANTPPIDQLTEISETASQALREVRQIIYNLRPYQLDNIGLSSALKFMLQQIRTSSNIEVTGEIDEIDDLFTPEHKIIIYRIVQESLNNIVKHSQATFVKVLITRQEKLLTLEISDNGCGFDLASMSKHKKGLGLSGMAERVKIIGGEQIVRSSLNQGTTIIIKIKINS